MSYAYRLSAGSLMHTEIRISTITLNHTHKITHNVKHRCLQPRQVSVKLSDVTVVRTTSYRAEFEEGNTDGELRELHKSKGRLRAQQLDRWPIRLPRPYSFHKVRTRYTCQRMHSRLVRLFSREQQTTVPETDNN